MKPEGAGVLNLSGGTRSTEEMDCGPTLRGSRNQGGIGPLPPVLPLPVWTDSGRAFQV